MWGQKEGRKVELCGERKGKDFLPFTKRESRDPARRGGSTEEREDISDPNQMQALSQIKLLLREGPVSSKGEAAILLGANATGKTEALLCSGKGKKRSTYQQPQRRGGQGVKEEAGNSCRVEETRLNLYPHLEERRDGRCGCTRKRKGGGPGS